MVLGLLMGCDSGNDVVPTGSFGDKRATSTGIQGRGETLVTLYMMMISKRWICDACSVHHTSKRHSRIFHTGRETSRKSNCPWPWNYCNVGIKY